MDRRRLVYPGAVVDERKRGVLIWLWIVYGMIVAMVAIGGVTRLTGSGLSMVEWRPLMGALPPMSDAEWQAVFEKYQESPQYQLVNHWMELADFQQIFFWEYVHRLFGRLIGMVFFVPWLVFAIRGRLRGRLLRRTFGAFVLGGLQGVMGWYMVKSGLVDVPAVSHYRLAAHLMLAALCACWVLWIALDLHTPNPQAGSTPTRRRLAIALVALVSIQVAWGALMAGARAGLQFDTFPTMGGALLFPDGIGTLGALDAFDNPITIHAIHRALAWLITLSAIAWWVTTRASVASRRRAATTFAGLCLAQIALGAATVILHVPTHVATVHQVVGFLLLSCGVWILHQERTLRT